MIDPESYEKPIAPLSVVKWTKSTGLPKEGKIDVGREFRIGFYSKQDGLDCIWLVNEEGEYEQTVDHEFLDEYFDLIRLSKIQDPFGENEEIIGPIDKDPR